MKSDFLIAASTILIFAITGCSSQGTPTAQLAIFDAVTLEKNVDDSYFGLAFDVNNDGRIDVIRSGLGTPAGSAGNNEPAEDVLGEVVWYESPNWTKHTIARLSVPVGLHHADIDGDGFRDIVISDEYGLCIFDCKPENGRVSWLRNPGKQWDERTWQRRTMGPLLATHRLRIGSFTSSSAFEVMAFPVVGGTHGAIYHPVNVTLFSKPENVLEVDQWPSKVINDSLAALHGDAFADVPAPHNSPGKQAVILASREGLTRLYYGADKKWHSELISEGDTEPAVGTRAQWQGSGDVDTGRHGDDPEAFLVALEPFHGRSVVLYTKTPDPKGQDKLWSRKVLDQYGEITKETAEGPGHHIVTGDFDGDGDDEFIVGLRGPYPSSGVFYYDIIDLEKMIVRRQRVSSASASRICTADFNGDGRLDFCTVPYVVATYYRADRPHVMVYLNRFSKTLPAPLPIKP